MRVLEFKHVGPFDGCFHRWEYLAVVDGEAYPIVFANKHLSPNEVLYTANGVKMNGVSGYPQALFKEFRWFNWDQELFDEIPYGYFPAFWQFAQEMEMAFTWACDECGDLQVDEPMHMAGYRGNGGIGIEVEGWLCEDCAYEQEARYEAQLVEEEDWRRRCNERAME